MSRQVKKTILIIFLLFIVVGITLFSYLYMMESKYLSATELTLEENEIVEVKRTLSHDPSKRLIPKGAILGVDDVNQVVISYLVTLDDSQDLTLDVRVNNLLIGNSPDYNHLINIDIIQNNENNNYKVEAILTLNMPANESEYKAIVNQVITFSLVFSAQKK